MESSNDITKIKAWNTKQVFSMILFSISLTFSATLIYSEFVIHGQKINVLEERLDKKIKLINSNTENINELKQQHFDNIKKAI